MKEYDGVNLGYVYEGSICVPQYDDPLNPHDPAKDLETEGRCHPRYDYDGEDLPPPGAGKFSG